MVSIRRWSVISCSTYCCRVVICYCYLYILCSYTYTAFAMFIHFMCFYLQKMNWSFCARTTKYGNFLLVLWLYLPGCHYSNIEKSIAWIWCQSLSLIIQVSDHHAFILIFFLYYFDNLWVRGSMSDFYIKKKVLNKWYDW